MKRLGSWEEFQVVMALGHACHTNWFVLHQVSLSTLSRQTNPTTALLSVCRGLDQEQKLGALVPKRWAKRAVTRNSVKRQIFSVVSEYQAHLHLEQAMVIRLRREIKKSEFKSARSSELLKKIKNELHELLVKALTT
jgi:ribonuclease P protein component